MKKIYPFPNLTNINVELFNNLVSSIEIDPLLNKKDKKKKEEELNSACKFLFHFLDSQLKIERLFEEPDVLLRLDDKSIGLEITTIINQNEIGWEKNFDKVFSYVQTEIQKNQSLPNIYTISHLHPYINIKSSEIDHYKIEVLKIVTSFYKTNHLEENEIISHISHLPDTEKEVHFNKGAWWSSKITSEQVEFSINEKKEKIKTYIKNLGSKEIWLLIVIGQSGAKSYDIDNSIELNDDLGFNRIFILESFKNQLYELR